MTARQRWLGLFETLTVGLPFCIFKLLTGLHLARSGTSLALGYALAGLGGLDALLNLTAALWVLIARRRAWAVCLLEAVVSRRSAHRREIGLALDTLLSFALVATMIGAGWLGHLGQPLLSIWNAAVIANVLGAGAMRVEAAFFSAAT